MLNEHIPMLYSFHGLQTVLAYRMSADDVTSEWVTGPAGIPVIARSGCWHITCDSGQVYVFPDRIFRDRYHRVGGTC